MPWAGRGKAKLADVAAEHKQIQQDLAAIRSDLERLKDVVRTLCDLAMQRFGIAEGELVGLVKKVEQERKNPVRQAVPCPACGRILQGAGEFCVYCGAKGEQPRLRF
ncbi:MAG: hypothetical protein N2255_03175 [Kiritimatiellae bacterium]|nr:hypothetical protein [Kiritimatiellia bacterium]